MMQKFKVIPSHAYVTHSGEIKLDKENADKEFFKFMDDYYEEKSSELIYVNENLIQVFCYKINDFLIFVANKPFQEKGLASVVISQNTLAEYLIKIGLEKQTGFKLIECKKWE